MNLAFNPLSLRVRTFAVLVVLLGALVVALLLLANTIFAEGFRQAEVQLVTERVKQAANALSDSLAGLSRVNRDYAVWDDSYAFVSAPDPAYVDNYLSDATFSNNHLSYIGFINPAGELVFARAFDLAEETEAPPPPGIAALRWRQCASAPPRERGCPVERAADAGRWPDADRRAPHPDQPG